MKKPGRCPFFCRHILEHFKWIIQKYSVVDLIFFLLRILTILGGTVWLILAPLSSEDAAAVFKALAAFSVYSALLYSFMFFRPGKTRLVYLASLVFDIIFVFFLVNLRRQLDNSFFLGYYLLTALHTFYFGIKFGLVVATTSAILYLVNVSPYFGHIHWTDLALRIAFLYLIAVPLGLLSGKLRRDKAEIEKLNLYLAETIEYLKRMQAKMVKTEKLSAVGRLTADIAHEIRNPLSALGGMARRLDRRLKDGTREKEYVKVILSEASRLETILGDIFILSSEEPHFFELKRGDINGPVKEAAHFFCDLCTEGKIRLVEDYAPDLPQVYFNFDQIKQAVGNLVTNAMDALMPGRGSITIRTGTEFTKEILWVTVSVSDTGMGIPEEKKDIIFEPFYSTKRIGHGTGLGLPIVRKIMEEHRGFIRFRSDEGKGITVFTLYFPYQSEDDDKKTPCWEHLKCGIEKDPSRTCPAYPYFGRICWAIAGTLCEGRIMGTYAQKIHECHKCPFYQLYHHGEIKERDATADFTESATLPGT